MAATNNRRDVKLGVEVETNGQEGLQSLAADVRNVGTAATASAPGVDRLTKELEGLTAATAGKRDAERAAADAERAARTELNARADALARTRAGADAATRASADHQAALRAERLAVVEARIALRDRAAALRTASTEARQAAAAEQAAAAQLAAAMRAQAGNLTSTATAVETLRGQYALLRNAATAALGGTLVGGLARDLAATADAYSNLGARIKLVAGEGQAARDALQGVQDIAQRTGASLETTGTLFTRILQAGKDFNLTQRDALALTESIGQAVQLSGASAQASDAAITQLVQGLQSGVLRGEEFNSVLEQSPRLALALAAGLNVTIGELRNLAQQGALTSQAVIGALQGQSAALQSEFDKMPPTVERALGKLSNAWTVYIGQAADATGATRTAAGAIDALAGNLDTLGTVLLGLGKAAAAYSVVRLAAGYFSATAAATTTATAATVAHTAALTANTAAQAANAAATAGSVAGAGRLAAALGSLKTFSVVGILTNYREIGTAIGEWVARMRGAGKVLEESERAQRADAEATRRATAEKAALAQATALATDRALGLNKEARALVAEFDGVVTKTNDTGEALAKLSKALRLDDLSGIQAASAALDALGQRGKLSADQIRTALAGALKDADLLQFETTARAAFDRSEQGARRLKAVLDAIADESLRRASTSAQELADGFSKAATSAINDVDTLARTLRDLGVAGDDAQRALAGALDKALNAATTERAVRAVIDRLEEMGRAGTLSGDRLADGLEKARKKLDELRPGINSLGEALRTFGLQTRSELQQTADRLGDAYRVISTSAGVSLRDQIEAYGKWRAAALKASGGVESGHLAEQRVILETRATVAGLGDEYERAMGRATDATRRAGAAMRDEAASVAAGFRSAASAARSILPATQYDKEGFALGADGQRFTAGAQLAPPDASGNWSFVSDRRVGAATGASYSYQNADGSRGSGLAVTGQGYWKAAGDALAQMQAGAAAANGGLGFTQATPAVASMPAPSAVGRTVNINIAGMGNTSVRVASDADAAKVEAVLRQLEGAMARMGA